MKSRIWLFVVVLAALAIRAGIAAAELPPPFATAEDVGGVTQDTGIAAMPMADDGQLAPLWRVRTDLLCMRLSKPNDAVLATDYTPGGNVLLNASEFKFGYECGPEIAIWRQINDDWNAEGRFFRIDGWSASRDSVYALGSDVLYNNPFGNEFLSATIAGSYRSELTNVEINGRWQINDFWSALLGFRYVGLDEGMTILQDFGPGYVTATHSIGAVNDLYGFQIGADMNLWSRGRLSIEGLFKAGIYGDHAVNSVHIPGSSRLAFVLAGPPTASYDSSASADGVAFAGEMSITGVYRFNEHLSLRAGYQLLWLEGVAQASDQVAVSDPLNGAAAVAFQGDPHYDGAFLGLELTR
jgi:hypothetical protein